MPTDTPTATATAEPNPSIYAWSTLPATGQATAVIYSVTAGELSIAALDLCILVVLVFMTFVLVVQRRRNG